MARPLRGDTGSGAWRREPGTVVRLLTARVGDRVLTVSDGSGRSPTITSVRAVTGTRSAGSIRGSGLRRCNSFPSTTSACSGPSGESRA
jgi:hypothetical protein